LKPNALARGQRHFRQIDGPVVGDFQGLSCLHTQHTGKVGGPVSDELGAAVAEFVYEKSPARHKINLMFAHLRGTLLEKHPNQAIVEVQGVGYDVTIPVSTYSKLPDTGAEVRLRVHTHVREDALALFGFLTAEEKTLFEKLIAVSGIGPKLAITVLSGLAVPDLVGAIRRGEPERLVRVPGVGKKTAERIVLELRDKLPGMAFAGQPEPVPVRSAVEQDVLSALLNLGCARPAAEAALQKAKAAGVPVEFEPLFRKALESAR